MFRRHSVEPAPSVETSSQPASRAELDQVAAGAASLWSRIRANQGNQEAFGGLLPSFNEESGRAELVKFHTPTVGVRLAIYFNGEGFWCIEKTRYVPGTEAESHGTITAGSTTFPLAEDEPVMSQTASYRKLTDGSLALETVHDVKVGETVTAQQAAVLGKDIAALSGAQVAA